MFSIPQSTSFVLVFKAYLASDHVTEATGKTIAITISKAGGAFGNPNAGATNATEISSGWYKVTLDTTDTGTLGVLAIRGAVATIDDYGDRLFVVKATNGGLTALPDTAVTTNASLVTSGTGTAQLSVASGTVDLGKILGTAVSTPATAGILDVNLKNIANAAVSASTAQLGVNVVNNAGSAITSASGVQEVKVASIAASAITATSIAADAITAAKVADGTIDAATFAAGAINAAAIAADAITDAKVAADVTIASVTGAVGSVTGLTASDVGAIKAKTDNLPSDPVDASDIAGAFSTVNSTLATIAGYIDTEVAAIKAKTDNLPASPAAVGSAMTLTAAYDAAKTAASQTSVDDLPTNAELATALGTADDATLSAIAALSIPTANQNADALLDRANGVETGLTPRQALRLSVAADAGKLSGAASTTNTIRNAVADSKDRIVATVDSDGNRTAITYDLT